MTPLQALVLGVVEGVTEYLPVSSTGHLILTKWALGLDKSIEQSEAIDAYLIIIQAGAIFAVIGLYRASIWQMLRGLIWRASAGVRSPHGMIDEGWVLARNVLLAFVPAAIVAFLLAGTVKAHLFHVWPVIGALAVGGIIMLLISPWQRRQMAHGHVSLHARTTLVTMTMGQAVVIGMAQCIAMWPGTSRSLVTIVAGLLIGLRAVDAAKFSFILGLVTLTAASGYETMKIVKAGELTHYIGVMGGWLPVIVGIIAAWASAALAVDLFVAYLGRHTLAIFGWWRLVVAALFAGAILLASAPPTISP